MVKPKRAFFFLVANRRIDAKFVREISQQVGFLLSRDQNLNAYI
jgi:hypothetical protein